MTRGFLDEDRQTAPRERDEELGAAVSKLDWRDVCRIEDPSMTDAECDADWRKHQKVHRR